MLRPGCPVTLEKGTSILQSSLHYLVSQIIFLRIAIKLQSTRKRFCELKVLDIWLTICINFFIIGGFEKNQTSSKLGYVVFQ
jgi:hypothetical protein